jgi:predicted dehydrogenase
MNEVAKQSNARFAMLFNQRTNCVYRKMKDIIESGGIGELQRVNWIITNWYRTQKYYDSGSWRATWKGEGGGVLINQCPHQIDLVQWVVGKMPVKVNGFCKYGRWHDVEVEDEVTAYFEYDNGATGVFITTTGEAPGVNRFEVTGTKGRLVAANNKLLFYKNAVDVAVHIKECDDPFEKPECTVETLLEIEKYPKHAGIINNFSAHILGEEPLFVAGEEGINGVELMNAIELSGWKGGAPVTLPVDEDEYLQMLNEKRKNGRKKFGAETVTNTMGTY